MDALPPVVVLGAGPLAAAVRTGLAAAGVAVPPVTTRTPAVLAGIVITGAEPSETADLLGGIGAALQPGAVVVGLAAGTAVTSLEAVLPPGSAVVRARPSTPVQGRRGVTVLSRGTAVTDEAFAAVQRLFGLLGEVVVLDDEQIDRTAAVADAAPAAVHLLVQRFVDAAIDLGFARAEAERTVHRTFAGALALLAATGRPPAELRRGVTSPNGTTAAAIAVLEQRDLAALIAQALDGGARPAAEPSAR